MTFGLSALALVVAIGASIDFGRQVTARSNLQQATDATALAIAHTYLNATSTESTLRAPTQTYLTGAMNSPAPSSSSTATANGVNGTPGAATLKNITFSSANTEMCIDTSMLISTTLMKIMGTNHLAVQASACAQTGQTFEVALVLDNSGSMASSAGGKSKIAALIDAATLLVDTLIPSGTAQPKVGISIIPFTALVNVGPSTTANFLDKTGVSSIHWQNFHRPSGAPWRPTSKLDLFSNLRSQTWRGCVEDRPYPYITTDTAASTSVPDSLFVPFLSPDDPGVVTTSDPGYSCHPSNENCGRYFPPNIYYNSYLNDIGASTSLGNCDASNTYANMDNASGTQSDGVYNQAPGYGMTMVCKYKGSTVNSYTAGTGVTTGPNYLCSSQQITPLTTSSTVLKNALSTMVAGGSTNVATGFMWGWRTISPVVNPFPTTSTAFIGPQNPKAYTGTTPQNTKVIILMTDGFNSWSSRPYNQWLSAYESFGYYVNNRLSNYSSGCGGSTTTASTYRCQMDAVTLEACTRAKAAGTVVYTIGFSTSADPIDAKGLSLLQSCASDSDKYFKASDSVAIVKAFEQIAASIQNLRLAE